MGPDWLDRLGDSTAAHHQRHCETVAPAQPKPFSRDKFVPASYPVQFPQEYGGHRKDGRHEISKTRLMVDAEACDRTGPARHTATDSATATGWTVERVGIAGVLLVRLSILKYSEECSLRS
jgi:hypothetical protein